MVEDRGRGFDPGDLDTEESSSSGLGLSGMRERLRVAGGDVEIESAPGRGTRVALRIPRDAALGGEPPARESPAPTTRTSARSREA